MQVVIPIAGKGKRMEKYRQGPKQLLPVAGQPLIEYTLAALPSEVDQLVLIVGGPHEEAVRAYFGGSHRGRAVTYVRQAEQLGLGHAIQQARDQVHGRFLQITPDDIFDSRDLVALVSEPDLGALVSRVEDPRSWGVFVTDRAGNVVGAVEKPQTFVSDLASTGAFLLDEEFFEVSVAPSARGEYELPDLVLALVKERGRKLKAVPANFWLPVNDPAQLSLAEQTVLRQRAARLSPLVGDQP